MLLEFEPNVSGLSLTDDATGAKPSTGDATELLRAGIKAAQEGRQAEARTLLLQSVEADPKNETAWLWLASMSESPEELLVFLNNVLRLNPENQRALEWKEATRPMLIKTLVQRGIEAARSDRKAFARQCFEEVLEHDAESESAWLWLAFVSDSEEEKLKYMEKVLTINPGNKSALAAVDAARTGQPADLLQNALSAAVAGDSAAALEMLETLLRQDSRLEAAWVLKSHLVVSPAERNECFEKILELNPANEMARANLESWQALLAQARAPVPAEPVSPPAAEEFVEGDEVDFSAEEPAAASVAEPFQAAAEDNLYEDLFEQQPIQLSADEYLPCEATAEDQLAENAAAHFDFLAAPSAEPVEELPAPFASSTDLFDGDENTGEAAEETRLAVEESTAQEPAPEISDTLAPAADFSHNLTEPATEAQDALPNLSAPEPSPETSPSSDHWVPPTEEWEHSLENPFTSFLFQATENAHEMQLEETPAFNAPIGEHFEQVTEEYAPGEITAPVADSPTLFGFSVAETPEEVEASEQRRRLESRSAEAESTAPGADPAMPSSLPTSAEGRAAEDALRAKAAAPVCPFCEAKNGPQAYACRVCLAVLNLSDLELLFAQQGVNQKLIEAAVHEIEQASAEQALEAEQLVLLGLGHLNLKNHRQGLDYLQEAVRLNPSNVVLSAQVNALAIRLAEIEEQAANGSGSGNRRILVVDDSPTVRKLIAGKLEKCGHEVICAVDGLDALEKIKEVTPDLILLDITMPRMDGYQVCKLIRNNRATKDIPVVMISGKDGFFDKVRGRMAGTSGYITKPFGPETLMKTVESFLSQA